ncbi:MAG: PAS domain S-box protein [Desulfomonilaceae bacterium]|nr:PAS domain S-box protein [Desulfomonilaceae bacterium]
MTQEKDSKEIIAVLRQRAEEALTPQSSDSEGISSLSPEEVQRLVHELRVHQIELEMQNEDLRQAQVKLEELKDRYLDLYDFAPVGYVTLNEKGFILEANLTAVRLLGVDRRTLIKRALSRFVCKAFQDAYYLHLQHVLETQSKQTCEIKLVREDGTQFYAQLESVAVLDETGQCSRCRTALTDTTERKQSQDSLRESEERFRLAMEATNDAIWDWDMTTGAVFRSARFYEMLGCEREGLSEKVGDWHYLVLPEDYAAVQRKLAEYLEGKREKPDVEFRVRKPSGEVIWIQSRSQVVARDETGKPLRMVGTHTDVTARKKEEAHLQETSERLRLAAKATSDVIWDWDVVNDAQYWNESGTAQFGWEDIVSSPQTASWWTDRIHPDDRERVSKGFYVAVEDPSRSHWEDEYRFRKADGTYADVLDRGYVIREGQGRARRMVGAMLNLTERKKAEESLRRNQAMLARTEGIAHVGSWEWDVEKDEVTWSDELFRIFQRDPSDGAPSFADHDVLYPPEDMQQLREVVAEAVTTGTPFEIDLQAIRMDGETRLCVARGHAEMGPHGRARRLYGSLQDITERMQMEHQLRETNRRLVESQRIAGIGTWDWIPATDEVYWSDETYRIFGLEPGSEKPSYELAKRLTHPEDIQEWEEALAQALETGTLFTRDYRAVRTDGSVIWVHNETKIIRDEQGNAIRVLGTAQDITERKTAEQALRESEERYRQITESSLTGIFIHQDGGGVYVNERLADMLGYSKEEMIGKNFIDAVHPADRDMVLERVRARLNGEQTPASYELHLLKKTGEEIWCEVLATLISYNGRPAIMGNLADITERKRAQESLRLSEERYRAIFDNAAVGIDVVDGEGRFIQVNGGMAAMLGYSEQELLNLTILDVTHPEDTATSEVKHMQMVRGETEGYRFQKRYVKKSGEHVWADVSASAVLGPDGSHIATVGVASDITDRVKAEEALRESEGRVRAKLESILSPEGDIGTLELRDVMDTEQVQTLMNDFYNVTKIGMAIVDLKGKVLVATGWQDICTQFHRVHPETRQNCITSDTELSQGVEEGSFKLYKCLNNMWDIATPIIVGGDHLGNLFLGQFLFEGEEPDLEVFRNQARKYGFHEGEYMSALKRVPRWTRETVESAMGFYSKFSRVLATLSYGNIKLARNLAARERLVRSLRESEERYRAVVDNLHIGISVMNRNLEIVSTNLFSAALFPMVKEGEGQRCYEMYPDPPGSSPCSYCPCVLTFQDGKVHETETAVPAGDRIRHFRIVSCPVKNERGEAELVMELVEDVTERRSLYAQLAQAQKMEAIGTLAGGVAHDFNNILQVALGYSELMLREETFPDHCRSDLKKIYESARRGADLVKRLLTFSRKTEMTFQPLSLNQRIIDLLKMLERTIPKMIDIELRLEKDLDRINADPTQTDQVLMNLAVNASDAMPHGGKLVIETANVTIDAQDVKTHLGLNPGPHVLLSVTDTGSGIDKDSLEKIFEPFFTTKGVGGGTGLGLAMVHGIVKQHGGHIECHSEPGQGTTFKIYFPAPVSKEEEQETVVGTMPRGGSETILLVDDEEMIRDLGSRILTKAGYKVITASNGKEALQVYQERGHDIALVILDLSMPEMGGKLCLQELVKIDPSIKVVIASGYSANGPTKDALAAGAKGFANKPYDIRQILEVVRKVLDET